ncbi:MAG: hypothetical protein Kow0092_40030 [Deferrisomatales bacterium]
MTTLATTEHLSLHRLTLGPFGTNAYVVACRRTGESAVVDAPAGLEEILAALEGTRPRYVLMTHSHADHTGALEALRKALGVPVAAHRADAERLPVAPDRFLEHGEALPLGGLSLRVLHTPGHTPGSVCYLVDGHLLSGDTLFPGGPGKTRSPGAFRQILESLTTRVFVLPADTPVHPGHGPSTEVGREKAAFEAFSRRPHDPGLCGDVTWASS